MTDYFHPRYGRIFVAAGLGEKSFGVFYRKPNGSLKRVDSPALPMCPVYNVVQANLDQWAGKLKLKEVQPL
jgi:hypothetical protein